MECIRRFNVQGGNLVDSKKVKAFLTAKRLGSLTGAAEALNYTQSGMTHMMNALEKELGVTLLHRGRNGVALTEEARELMPQLTAFAAAADALDEALDRMHNASPLCIRIGTYSSMAQHWIPNILHRFRAEQRGADISMRMGSIDKIYGQLKSGELDCAFVSYQPSEFTDALEWISLHNDELVAILPPDHPAQEPRFDVRGFERCDFLMPANGFEMDIAPMFEQNGIRPGIRFTNLDDPAIISLVEHGLGLSVLADLVMLGRTDNILVRPLNPPAYRELGIAYRSESLGQPLFCAFLEHAKTAVAEFYA